MPIYSGWDNAEKTIYRYTVSGRWTLAEFIEHSSAFKANMAQVAHPVFTIVDLRGAQLSTGNLMDAAQIVFATPVPNDELIVLIRGGQLYQRTLEGVEKILSDVFLVLKTPTIWVKTDKQAYQAIEDYRKKHRLPGG